MKHYFLHNVSCSFVKNNIAVIPGDWETGNIKTAFYDMQSDQPSFRAVLKKIKNTDFSAWDHLFFEIIGQQATLERIQSFEGEQPTVHEAPAYGPETNELIYADTSVTGWLWAINVDTLTAGKLKTTPPLRNVNEARYHKGAVYLKVAGARPSHNSSYTIRSNYSDKRRHNDWSSPRGRRQMWNLREELRNFDPA